MRAIFVFVLFFCFLMLTGKSQGYASNPNQNALRSSTHLNQTSQIFLSHTNHSTQVVQNNGLKEKKEEFISVENEDEDLVFTKKYVLLVNYFIAIACASLLSYFFNFLKNRLPFCWHLSYTSSNTYLLQRVLRL